jgi:2-methylcitrate dehydratase PrpD
MKNPIQELAGFVVDTRYEDLPEKAIHDAKFLFLDSIGCALAGLSIDSGKMGVALARRLGGPPEASVIGTGDKVASSSAALVNGDLIRAVDYCAMPPGGHTPEQIIPPPLAIAESLGASGKDLILSTALGFEIAARISNAHQRKFQFGGRDVKNFRVTEDMGKSGSNLGATAAVCKLLQLNHDKTANALGISGHLSQSPTNTKFTFGAHRPLTKYGVPGWQNLGCVIAAWLAEDGYAGDTTFLDAENGSWTFASYEGWQPEKIMVNIGEKWIFTKVNYKPYPCCRMFHTQLDCFFNIIKQNNLSPEEVESVKAWGHPVYDYPLFTNRELNTAVDVQFGGHYLMGIVAHGVPLGVDWQDLNIVRNPKIIEFSRKVKIQSHPDFEKQKAKDPFSHLGKVEVIARGKTFAEERIYSKGTPDTEFAMTDEELIKKFRHNSSRILTQEKSERATKMLLELENIGNISHLMDQVTL